MEGLGPVGARRGRLEGRVIGADVDAVFVAQEHMAHLVLLGVGVLDVTDGIRQALHKGRHAFIALTASTDRPVDGRAFTDLGFPLGVHLGQVVGEDEGRAGTVGAANRSDGRVGQRHAGVQRQDRRVVPLGDLAQKDIAEHRASQSNLTWRDALDVDHWHHAADHGGELDHPVLGQIGVGQRHVRGTKVHRLGTDLPDAST